MSLVIAVCLIDQKPPKVADLFSRKWQLQIISIARLLVCLRVAESLEPGKRLYPLTVNSTVPPALHGLQHGSATDAPFADKICRHERV